MNSSEDQKDRSGSDAGSLPADGTTQAPAAPASTPVTPVVETNAALARRPGGTRGGNNPPSGGGGGDDDEGDEEEDGMLRMSFLDHLTELRSRIIRALIGFGVAFGGSLFFADELWKIISEPAVSALTTLHFEPKLAQLSPMEAFNVVWMKLPVLCAIFLASPWVLWQVWGFISPGLYRRERRWAVPFVLCTAGLFITGGLFAYFVAFRFGLVFLLGIGRDINIKPVVSVSEYFDLFVNVTLGIGVVFELPILIFFLILLRIVRPGFLIAHSRYAILAIFIIAAIVTPTPDIFNMMIFAVPMCLLFYLGVFAGYLLVLHRENRTFPWKKTMMVVLCVLILIGLALYVAMTKYGLKLVPHWPFLVR